ncbi:MAG: hypothetical protein PW786_11625 [Arachidicoccus sp.]|nr:hypothetical protein [Arachidicoccus sp.]
MKKIIFSVLFVFGLVLFTNLSHAQVSAAATSIAQDTAKAKKTARKAKYTAKKAKAAAAAATTSANAQTAQATTAIAAAPATASSTVKAAKVAKTKTVKAAVNKSADQAIGTDAKGRTIYQGPKGGKYILTSSGNKEYLKKS